MRRNLLIPAVITTVALGCAPSAQAFKMIDENYAKAQIVETLVDWQGASRATAYGCVVDGRAWLCKTRAVYTVDRWGDRMICYSKGRTFGRGPHNRNNVVNVADWPESCTIYSSSTRR